MTSLYKLNTCNFTNYRKLHKQHTFYGENKVKKINKLILFHLK
jgi:hypothetical protein